MQIRQKDWLKMFPSLVDWAVDADWLKRIIDKQEGSRVREAQTKLGEQHQIRGNHGNFKLESNSMIGSHLAEKPRIKK